MREHVVINDEEFAIAAEEEKRRRHDVMAHVRIRIWFYNILFDKYLTPQSSSCMILTGVDELANKVSQVHTFGQIAPKAAVSCVDAQSRR